MIPRVTVGWGAPRACERAALQANTTLMVRWAAPMSSTRVPGRRLTTICARAATAEQACVGRDTPGGARRQRKAQRHPAEAHHDRFHACQAQDLRDGRAAHAQQRLLPAPTDGARSGDRYRHYHRQERSRQTQEEEQHPRVEGVRANAIQPRREVVADHPAPGDTRFEVARLLLHGNIRNLRRKIDDAHAVKLIHTVRGAGYRLAVDQDATTQ
jgi:hypothetical protein